MDIRNFTYFLNCTLDCKDPLWAPHFPMVDEKWWGSMNFVGLMESVSSHAKKLLESLSSLSDDKNVAAWKKNKASSRHTGGFMRQNICAKLFGESLPCRMKIPGLYAIWENTVGKLTTIVQYYGIRVVCLYFQNEIYRWWPCGYKS